MTLVWIMFKNVGVLLIVSLIITACKAHLSKSGKVGEIRKLRMVPKTKLFIKTIQRQNISNDSALFLNLPDMMDVADGIENFNVKMFKKLRKMFLNTGKADGIGSSDIKNFKRLKKLCLKVLAEENEPEHCGKEDKDKRKGTTKEEEEGNKKMTENMRKKNEKENITEARDKLIYKNRIYEKFKEEKYNEQELKKTKQKKQIDYIEEQDEEDEEAEDDEDDDDEEEVENRKIVCEMRGRERHCRWIL